MDRIVEISASSFGKTVLESDEPVMVEFFSRACPHCRLLDPTYEELHKALEGEVKFVKVDVLRSGRNCRLAVSRGVRSVPTLEVFYRGRVIGSIIGYHELDKLVNAIKSFISKKEEYIGPSTPLNLLPPSP